MSSKIRHRHVGILVETEDSWGRSIVEAVCRYAQRTGWTVMIAPRDQQGRLRLPRVWGGHGVIASLRNRSMVGHVRRLGVPVVDVSLMVRREPWFARVGTDDGARAEMAVEHLMSRGIRSFACYSPPIGRYSDARSRAFRLAVEAKGLQCDMYSAGDADAAGWLNNYNGVSEWLHRLPRPLGVFAADPYPARQLVEICSSRGIRIPDDVAVLSGDDDELLCNVASPQISSIELASYRIGETSCEILTRLMNRASVPDVPTLIPPLRIRARHSTDILAIDDEEIAEILRHIRSHACEGMTVADLVRTFPVSRRTLEQRFRHVLNCSPAEEIRRVRLEHVCRCLVDTDMPISSVAFETGFASGASLSQAFRQQFGETPGRYRASRRP